MGNDKDVEKPRREGGRSFLQRDRDSDYGVAGMMIGGVLIGAALIGLVWVVVSLQGSPHPVPESPVAANIGNANVGNVVSSAPTAQPPPDRQERCAGAVSALSAPLQAAKPAMDQWEIHIGAMNKLVVGAITLDQANQFWNQTRVGAARRIQAFNRALEGLRQSGVDCPAPSLLAGTASPTLRACSQLVSDDLRTVDVARAAISTWSMHVRDMERLRAGTLAPAVATKMWLSMWQRGQHQLDAYRQAARDARRITGCTTGPTTAASTPAAPSSSQPSDASSSPMDMGGMQ